MVKIIILFKLFKLPSINIRWPQIVMPCFLSSWYHHQAQLLLYRVSFVFWVALWCLSRTVPVNGIVLLTQWFAIVGFLSSFWARPYLILISRYGFSRRYDASLDWHLRSSCNASSLILGLLRLIVETVRDAHAFIVYCFIAWQPCPSKCYFTQFSCQFVLWDS